MRLEYGDSDVEGASRLLDMKVVKRNVLIFKLGFFLWNFCRSPSRSRSPLPSLNLYGCYSLLLILMLHLLDIACSVKKEGARVPKDAVLAGVQVGAGAGAGARVYPGLDLKLLCCLFTGKMLLRGVSGAEDAYEAFMFG
ncbi:hypothetical protein Goshw_030366 [Gossypium schwendimanii]|uniref:Uncharacterized protein n=2 Tax=Gossypium TaxID=3633 RepID=A0A7J9LSD7_GOSSC|nr:hypothetical protein [Gossypium harknessii]MBA0861683.1 hypothetical protein [Gossypium schwendimanii]